MFIKTSMIKSKMLNLNWHSFPSTLEIHATKDGWFSSHATFEARTRHYSLKINTHIYSNRFHRPSILTRLLDPRIQHTGNLITVLLHEMHVTIAVDPNIRQFQVLNGNTRLLQEVVRAVIINSMVTCFASLQQKRDVLEVGKLPGRLGLDYAGTSSSCRVVDDLGAERSSRVCWRRAVG